MRLDEEFTKGLVRENPVFVMLLGLCPTLAVTTGLKNAIGMGLASTFVVVASNLLISLLKTWIPKEIRIPCYIVVIATFVTMVKLTMAAHFPVLKEALGIFLPLIVVNCMILGRAEAFASRHGPLVSVVDGLGVGVGFTGALSLIAIVRELLGAGQLWGIPLARGLDPYTFTIFIIAPGGFLTMGLLLGLFNWLADRRREQARAERSAALIGTTHGPDGPAGEDPT